MKKIYSIMLLVLFIPVINTYSAQLTQRTLSNAGGEDDVLSSMGPQLERLDRGNGRKKRQEREEVDCNDDCCCNCVNVSAGTCCLGLGAISLMGGGKGAIFALGCMAAGFVCITSKNDLR